MSARGDNARRILETTVPAWFCDMLRAYHAGSDRGELRALLVEAWGPSPAVSDWGGLAARESARPDPCLDPDKMHGAADGFGGSDY